MSLGFGGYIFSSLKTVLRPFLTLPPFKMVSLAVLNLIIRCMVEQALKKPVEVLLKSNRADGSEIQLLYYTDNSVLIHCWIYVLFLSRPFSRSCA